MGTNCPRVTEREILRQRFSGHSDKWFELNDEQKEKQWREETMSAGLFPSIETKKN